MVWNFIFDFWSHHDFGSILNPKHSETTYPKRTLHFTSVLDNFLLLVAAEYNKNFFHYSNEQCYSIPQTNSTRSKLVIQNQNETKAVHRNIQQLSIQRFHINNKKKKPKISQFWIVLDELVCGGCLSLLRRSIHWSSGTRPTQSGATPPNETPRIASITLVAFSGDSGAFLRLSSSLKALTVAESGISLISSSSSSFPPPSSPSSSSRSTPSFI